MAVVIHLKTGSGVPGSALASGEAAFATTNHILYVGDGAINTRIGSIPIAQSFTAQTSVTVTHNLGHYPIVQVIDNTGAKFDPTSITHASVNAFTVVMATSTTGNILYI